MTEDDKDVRKMENLKRSMAAEKLPYPRPRQVFMYGEYDEQSPQTGCSLPDDDKERGEYPLFEGFMAYFPNAMAYVAKISKMGNDKHNPGQPLHWSRWNSTNHGDKILRHQVDAGKKDGAGFRHSGYVAWRAMAQLQEELEREEGYPVSRGSKTHA